MRGLFTGWLIALLAGCATVPPIDKPELAEIRNDYQAIAGIPQIRAHAAVPLFEAQQAIERAEATNDAAEYHHQIYRARRYLEIAQVSTNRALTEREVERLAAERNRLRRELRTREEAEAEERLEALEAELAALEATRVDRGLKVTLPDGFFENGRIQLSAAARDELQLLADFLTTHPQRTVVVEGHSDSFGDVAYNRMVSGRRAEAVKQQLIERGIAPERIVTRGYGESRPIASNQTAAGRQLNRRVEVVILAEGVEAPPEPGEAAGFE